jgi:hypothetical protein
LKEPREDSHRASQRSRERERGVWSPYQSHARRPMCSFGDNVWTVPPRKGATSRCAAGIFRPCWNPHDASSG